MTHDVKPPSEPWSEDISAILDALGADPENGLGTETVRRRHDEFGPNRLRQGKKKSLWQILLNQFKSMIIVILIGASVLSFIFTGWVDGLAIAVAVILNTLIGFFMELKAVRSMEALRQMERITAKVLRGGRIEELHAAKLVPGDLVLFESGDIVSADMRLIEASKLQVNESMLTGESVPVTKQTDPVDRQAPVAERKNMLFKGTSITRGSGKAIVTAIGMQTELGSISSLVEESEEEFTPLEQRLSKLGTKLLWVTLGVLAVVATLGILRGKETLIMIETAVALAVAAIPEGLPIVATIAMARGMLRMAQRNALVNRLAAVETLGGTNVIFTDKTGTLTENRMTVTEFVLPTGPVSMRQEQDHPFEKDAHPVDPSEDPLLYQALQIGVLCSNASLKAEQEAVGDPLESALLQAGAQAGLHRDELLQWLPEQREEAFDPATKMMATFHQQNDEFLVAVKGSPEAVLAVCDTIAGEPASPLDDSARQHWRDQNEQLASKGLRVLAVASKTVTTTDADPYENLTWTGLVGMMDPPRQDVRQAISLCRDAGLKVVMVTGDQAQTAQKIAAEVGLTEQPDAPYIHGRDIQSADALSQEQKERFLAESLFVRVSPEQKLDLITIYRQSGAVVAMTGDGVNDAPGLQKADIGIAMGRRGTQVAREASDMILKDDAFSTIVAAIEQGRVIFNNIRKFIVYLLSGNASEIMIVLFASLVNAPLPILPLQILLLNIISDVFPSLALGLGEGSGDEMKHPPRNPREPVLTKAHWIAIFGYGLLIALPVLGAFAAALYGLKLDTDRSITVAFLTLAFARLWHIFNMRDKTTTLLRNEVVTNIYVWMAIGVCTILLLSVVYIDVMAAVLKLSAPGWQAWLLILAVSLVPFLLGQAYKFAAARFVSDR